MTSLKIIISLGNHAFQCDAINNVFVDKIKSLMQLWEIGRQVIYVLPPSEILCNFNNRRNSRQPLAELVQNLSAKILYKDNLVVQF